MDKKYKPLRNTKPVKWIFSIMMFILVNITGLMIISTNYMEELEKVNNYATFAKIRRLIKPVIIGKKNQYMYFPSGNWEMIMKKTPRLTSQFQLGICSLLVGSLIILTMPYWKKKKLKSHGEAEFGTYDDLKKNKKKPSDVDFLSGNENGFVIGYVKTLSGKLKLLYDTSMIHIALFLPTRGGKGVGYIIPSLVAGLKERSTFISDIKKENYELTSWYRAKILKHKILKFEPMSELSNSYNFLSEVRYGTNYEIEDCRIIGTMIVGEDESKDPFWGDSAKDTISTLTSYVHYREVSSRPEEDPDITDVRVSLNDVISIITNTENSLYRMFAKYLGKPMEEDEYEDEMSKDFILKKKTVERLRKIYTDDESIKALNKGLHPFVAKQFGYLLQNTGENTFKSITSTAKTKLQVFEIPSIVKNIGKSDFRALDLVNGNNPVDLYFVIKPKDIDLLAPLVRIMYIQLTNLLMESLSKKNFNIIFLMDELNAYGRMKPLVKGLGYYAGFGIKMVGIFQGLDQLNSTYDKQGKEVLNGCQIQVFGRPNDEAAPDYISKTLGKETIRVKSKNIGLKGGGNVSEQGKDLLSPSETRLLPDRKAVVITGYKRPLLLDKLYYYEYPELLKRTQHQPVFFKDGYVIFEAMKGMYEYEHTFRMKEEDFYDDIKYEKIIEKARKKYKSEKIG
ncbi:type IV secretory system conjugative DNA transfer family protein [Leptotrichia massiliensis]|uniref:type IV secretory system conjugative DNA transfer family protein n=1 Tax=Leptotrichia massiliensis TaxID=1852388 RepID=UPI0028D393FF|nr:type IV secretory system conjugative DNA transfer family protein [Leptotrichia massiliensis]